MYIPAADAYIETPMSRTNPSTAIGTPMQTLSRDADHADQDHEQGAEREAEEEQPESQAGRGRWCRTEPSGSMRIS